MIWVGTSGFQYPEWKGKFYPVDLSTTKMLPFYAAHFPTTEINYSFYRVPSEKSLLGWSSATPAQFRFSLKAPQKITHHQKLEGPSDTLEYFWKVAQTLDEKLGPILFQLPPFLKKNVARLDNFLNTIPTGMKATFEFRHESWFDDEVYAALKSRGAALCIADSEKLHTPVVMTSDFGYFRLRDQYGEKELQDWAEIISEQQTLLKEIYVYFKHEESGSGPEFASQLSRMLGEGEIKGVYKRST